MSETLPSPQSVLPTPHPVLCSRKTLKEEGSHWNMLDRRQQALSSSWHAGAELLVRVPQAKYSAGS